MTSNNRPVLRHVFGLGPLFPWAQEPEPSEPVEVQLPAPAESTESVSVQLPGSVGSIELRFPPAITDTADTWLTQPVATVLASLGVFLAACFALYTAKRRHEQAEKHFTYEREQKEKHFTLSNRQDRFTTIASQLADPSAAVRVAGVYAMEALINHWLTYPLGDSEQEKEEAKYQAQTCINVLCSYLREPYEAAERGPAHVKTVINYEVSGRTAEEHYERRSDDRQVRQSIVRVMASHLQLTTRVSWSQFDFDFTGAYLEDSDFSRCVFKGDRTFKRAQFHGTFTRFNGAQFHGGKTFFHGAQFHGETTWFHGAQFLGEDTFFHGAQFHGENTSFEKAQFHGETTSFDEVQFHSETTDFDKAQFHSETTSFHGAQFHSEYTWFDEAQFHSKKYTRFEDAQFHSKTTDFDKAHFHGETTSFKKAQFHGETTSFHGAQFHSEYTWLDEVHFHSKKYTRFKGAQFRCESTYFFEAQFHSENTSFDEAQFHSKYTWFNGAQFHGETTSFRGATFTSGRVDFSRPLAWRGVQVDWDWPLAGAVEGPARSTQPANVLPEVWPPPLWDPADSDLLEEYLR